MRVLKHFSNKNQFSFISFHLYLSSFSLSSLSFSLSSFLFTCLFSFIFSSLVFHLLSSLLLSFIFSPLSSSLLFHLLSSFIISSLSLSSLWLLWLLWLLLCVVCCVLCAVWCVVWHAENPRVSIQNVPLCARTTRACVTYTWGRFLNGHTGGRRGHRQFCLPKFAHVGLSRASEVHHFEFLTPLTFRALHGHLAKLRDS